MDVGLHILTQIILHTCSQYRHLRILTQGVIRSRTPNHINVGIQLVKEVVYFLQFTHIDGMRVARVNIKQYTLGLADIVAIQ